MEDLRKIRPVISFIMENYEEIFSEGFEPVSPVKFSTDASGHKVPSSFAYDKTEDISSLMSSSMMIDTGVRADDASITSMEESVEEHSAEKKDPNSLSPRSLEMIRPNLKLTIPLTLPPSPAYSDMSSTALSQLSSGLSGLSTVTSSLDTATSESLSSSTLSSLQHYTDAEWSVLEAILLSTASAFLDLDSPRSSDAMQGMCFFHLLLSPTAYCTRFFAMGVPNDTLFSLVFISFSRWTEHAFIVSWLARHLASRDPRRHDSSCAQLFFVLEPFQPFAQPLPAD